MPTQETNSPGWRPTLGGIILAVVSVQVFVGLPYVMWRLQLLSDNQNLLMDGLTVKSKRMSQTEARQYMTSQGHVFDPGPKPERDYFYLGKGSASTDWSVQSVRGYVDYRDGKATDAGVEVIRGYL